jgi:hypothetical protein
MPCEPCDESIGISGYATGIIHLTYWDCQVVSNAPGKEDFLTRKSTLACALQRQSGDTDDLEQRS